MTRQNETSELLSTAERRALVLKLRKAGADYRDIAAQVEQRHPDRLPKGWDERYAWKDVKRELDRLRKEIAEDSGEVLTLELQRLDRLWLVMYQQAQQGDQGAIDRCLRIMKRRADLLGLDAPKRHQIEHTWKDGVVEDLRNGRATPAEVRETWPDLAAELFAQAGVTAEAEHD